MPASIWICLLLFADRPSSSSASPAPAASLYAIGGNVDAARAAGIRTDRVLWIDPRSSASVLAALGGLLLSGRLASVAAAQGNGEIFTVFAAAVIGGVSLNGGKGTMFGAFTGVLLLYMIQNVLTLAGVPAQWIGALNGAIILVALMVSRITSGKRRTEATQPWSTDRSAIPAWTFPSSVSAPHRSVGCSGPSTRAAAVRTLHQSLDLGINLIDVSPYYGLTRAETCAGQGSVRH